MKTIGNNDSSTSILPAAPPADADAQLLAEHRRTHGRRLEIAEDSDLIDLLRAYTESSLAQFNSLIATSRAVVQDVAYVLGLKAGKPDSVYEFAPFTETVTRHCGAVPGTSAGCAESAAEDAHGNRALAGGGSPTGEEASAPAVEESSSPSASPSVAAERSRASAPSADAGRRSFTGQLTAAETLAWTTALAQVEAETGTKFGTGRGRKKNRAAGRHLRRVRMLAQQLLDSPEPLPDFPGFDPKLTFFTWLRGNIEMTEAGVYSSLLGATTSNSLRHMTSAMTFAHGLPKFLRRCLDGDFTIEHVDCVTRACRDLHFEHFPAIDNFLARRRADITIETFKRSLALKIAATQPPDDTLESVALRRRVDYSAGDDGTAYLTLTGPAPELQACYRRLDAFARAVYKSNTSAFSGQLKDGDCFDEDRSISALMFDILTRTRPQMKLRIISTNGVDGKSTNTDFPLDGLLSGIDGVPLREGESLLDLIERVFDDMDANGYSHQTQAESARAQDDPVASRPETADLSQITPAHRAFESQLLEAILSSRTTPSDSTGPAANKPVGEELTGALASLIGSRASGARPAGEDTGEAVVGSPDAFGLPIRHEGARRISFEFLLDMPTNEYWLSNQARTFITVPMLTLLSQLQEQCDGDHVDAHAGEAAAPPPSGAPPTSEPPPEGAPPVSEPPPTGAPSTFDPPPTDSSPTFELPPSDAPLTSDEVCNLAGTLPDGSPIPADMARRVAGYSTTWTRLLTDPATGTPVDAKATTYAIPNSIRRTLVAQFVTCTFPGCTRPAETTEIDHIDPFNHSDPSQGGLTRFGNLHCLCKVHHQQKTDGKYDVRMTEPGHLEYVFRRGATVEVVVPDNPLNVEHARLFLERFGRGMPRTNKPPDQEKQPAPGGKSPSSNEKSSSAHDKSSSSHEKPLPSPDCGSLPTPGERRRASACPEPAAADGQPGWREADPHSITSFQPSAPTDPAERRRGSESPTERRAGSESPTEHRAGSESGDDPAVLRDWFWDSGEPPPF